MAFVQGSESIQKLNALVEKLTGLEPGDRYFFTKEDVEVIEDVSGAHKAALLDFLITRGIRIHDTSNGNAQFAFVTGQPVMETYSLEGDDKIVQTFQPLGRH